MKPYLSVIIPAYNEAKRLPLTLIDIDKHLSKADFSYEIIVVNDGSKDGTAEIVNRFSHLVKNLSLIDNKINHGKGWVVKQGMLESKGNIRLFMDSDNATKKGWKN
ncbi:MAG: glycosyltransferase [Candidatus Wolfebacteria bacterium]|nr:glycosyltransferase [Candidatus Wolfebacteria bacterium]